MYRYIFLILTLSLYLLPYGNAQSEEALKKRQKTVLVSSCNFILDSLTVAPSSVTIRSEDLHFIENFGIQNRSLIIGESECERLLGTFITVSYRVLSFDLEEPFYHLDSTQMKVVDRAIYIGSDYNYEPKGKQIIDAKGLDYNGSFSRGFSVGNSQSLVLNSNFNLQLAGDLGNGLGVVAAISDDNIPIQPEGNTQLIQEFDRVFIKVSKDKTNVVAGDYNLERPNSYFVNYFKKVKGLSVNNIYNFNNEKSISTKGSFAVSRGKFARQILDTKEGNQGPYKLTGSNGERFLIVLSGSEKVYLDGRLLERGLDYDYIIDYNRAELTFTPNRLIGRETRIIVEYEYRVQNYLRSVYAADVNYSSSKYDLSFNFYNEQDSKNATGDIVLNDSDIQQLSLAGDNLDRARVNSFQLANDSITLTGQIRYRLNTNVMPGDTAPFFLEFSNDPMENLYVASFSETAGGRYVIDESTTVNGRVYTYVGEGNGNYDPFTSLIPPEKKQVMSFGAQIRPKENVRIGSEVSLSNNDLNRFASIGNDDNVGLAGVLTYSHNININSKKKISLTTDNKYEYVHENYLPLNPYREAEFTRDWNLKSQIIRGQQNLLNSSIHFGVADSIRLSYEYKYFGITNEYKGVNQKGELAFRFKGFSVNGKMDFLNSEDFEEKTLFKRPKVEISQVLNSARNLRIGAIYESEINERRSLLNTSELLGSSFAFDIYSAYIRNREESKFHYGLKYSTRRDLFPDGANLIESIATNEVTVNSKWQISPNHGLSFNFGLRDFQVTQMDLTPQNSQSKKTLIGRLDHNIQALDGLILSNTNYIINSGQEPKIEYFFEKVEQGQGDYIYIGNPDSILINANFRYAPDLGTGEYIRLSLINNEFISTNNQSITQSLRLDPKKYFSTKRRKTKENAKQKRKEAIERKKLGLEPLEADVGSSKNKSISKFEKIVSKFSTISTFRISKKVEDDGTQQSSTFLNFSSQDPNLVSYSSLISNTLFVNRGDPAYDFQLGNKVSENVFTQISGLEQRNLNEYFLRSRIKIGRMADFILNLKNGNKGYDSKIFPDRNLDIDFYKINPEISYRPSTNLRINLLYAFDERKQTIGNLETADSHDFTLTSTFRQAENTNINFSLSFVNVKTDVEPNSAIEFDLLDGLKNGKNFIWNTLFTKRLSNNVDLNISYEGRKSEGAQTVHIARAQVKATF